MNTVYLKTDAGRAEIEQRQADIGALARRVLILVDGRRDATALATLAGLDAASVTAILIRLQALGLLVSEAQASSTSEPAATASPIEPAAPTAPAPQSARIAVDEAEPSPESVELVKQIMSESLTRYVGLLGKPLNEQIDAVDTPDSLKKTVAKWGMALRESRHGREHAHRYLQQVNDLLGWQH